MIKIDKLENLLQYVISVPFNTFRMESFTENDKVEHACNSQNCIIGNWINHLILTNKIVPVFHDDEDSIVNKFGFNNVDYSMTESEILCSSSDQFTIMFSGIWGDYRFDNTKKGAIQRIKFVLDVLRNPDITPKESETLFSDIAKRLAKNFYDTTHYADIDFTAMTEFYLNTLKDQKDESKKSEEAISVA